MSKKAIKLNTAKPLTIVVSSILSAEIKELESMGFKVTVIFKSK